MIANSRMRRTFLWNRGHLVSLQLSAPDCSVDFRMRGRRTDCHIPGHSHVCGDGKLTIRECRADAMQPERLEIVVECSLHSLELRRRFILYPDCPALVCDYFLKGRPSRDWHVNAPHDGLLGNLEHIQQAEEGRIAVPLMERLQIRGRHLLLKAVRFFDITDRRNCLVQEQEFPAYARPETVQGNLLLIHDPFHDERIFVLKRAPCSDVLLASPGFDFLCMQEDIAVAGLGARASDLKRDTWTRCYGFVTGIASGGERALLSALRDYQSRVRLHKPGRDCMIMLNTWGDRGRDEHLSEAFAFAELEAGAKLGVSHFQLDDGWQSGRTSNSASPGGSMANIWQREDFWDPHPERFPRGLGPVVEKAGKLGLELSLWFHPSGDRSYANWRKDADALIHLHKTYGIGSFKIDGVDIADKESDIHLRAMFDRVMRACGGDVAFHLDLTAGRRFGYHYFNEYGNIFLENRYTDWGNYQPCWTLRNLWTLSRYVPAQNFQIEFLNTWRNPDRYVDRPVAPRDLSFSYCFAVAMMAQPLAWFEASRLPEEAFAIREDLRRYREIQWDMQQGKIYPIGEPPTGTAWTGFQSVLGDRGYVLVFREGSDRLCAKMTLWHLRASRVQFSRLIGDGEDFSITYADEQEVPFHLDSSFSFCLYAYAPA